MKRASAGIAPHAFGGAILGGVAGGGLSLAEDQPFLGERAAMGAAIGGLTAGAGYGLSRINPLYLLPAGVIGLGAFYAAQKAKSERDKPAPPLPVGLRNPQIEAFLNQG